MLVLLFFSLYSKIFVTKKGSPPLEEAEAKVIYYGNAADMPAVDPQGPTQ